MARQLLPLRILTFRGAFGIFSRHLTSHLKPRILPCNLRRNLDASGSSVSVRTFSSRSGRSRDHHRRGGVAGQGKSLIDDEAELSDWVSDLKTDSFRLGLSGDDDRATGDRARRNGGRDRGRDSASSMRNQGALKRGRDIDSDGFSRFSDKRQSRKVRGSGSFSRERFDSELEEDEDENEDEDEDEDDLLSSWQRKKRGSRAGFSNGMVRRGGKEVETDLRQKRSVRGPNLDASKEEEDDDEKEASGSEDDFFGDMPDMKEGNLKNGLISASSRELVEENNATLAPRRSFEHSESYLSETRFDQCSISPLSLKGIKAAGYERMTIVQEATLPLILKGKDVLAKAKTGTGKTVAFLLPAIEVVVKLSPVDRDQKRPPVNVLVICPTRELASQAATEAETLLKFHPSIGVQVVIGGTRLSLEQKRMQANPCQILVATPGRLRDHLENTPGFATRLMGVKVLVLDEADRLLDMGFRKDIEKIVAAVPKQRQTLLFSATVPDEVRQVCYFALKRDHEFVNTVEEGSEETHSQVKQMQLVAPLEKQFSILYALLTEHIAEDVDYKVIVFCTTAMVTRLVADLLAELHLNVREIHSRKPQSYRTRVSKEFKESKGLILVSSDVSARGVDYPDVTLVIQVGIPADREQYIHRLGRTGRKGKEGKGILMLAPWEDFFLSSIKDLPITKAPLPLIDPDTRKKVERAIAHVEMKNKESAYQAWLGYYNSNKSIGRDKHHLVTLANEFSRSMGLDTPPSIPKLVLRKMGLNNVPGLRTK
ncbi:putative RNA helicase [Dioscorea sansibarensis]